MLSLYEYIIYFEDLMNDPENKRQHVGLNKSLWLSLIATIVAIIALITASFSWTEYKQDKASTSASSLSSNIEQQTIKTSLQQLDTKLDNTQQNVARLMASVNNNQQQSTLSQISYLINLANLQLNINHNIQSALHLLNLAQTKVDALDDPRLFALNKSLLSNIQTLKSAPTFSIAKLVADIDALSDKLKISKLMPDQDDLKKAQQQATQKAQAVNEQPDGKWYHRLWHHVSGVKNLVIIRHNQGTIKPLLGPEQQSLLKSMMQSKLTLAEFAAIMHNNTVFQKELSILKKWINTYYQESINRAELLEDLNTIMQTNVDPKIPDINDTIAVLNQSINMAQESSTTPKPKQKDAPKPQKKPFETEENSGVAI